MSLRQNEENIQSIVKETGSTQTDTNYPAEAASWNPEFKNKVRWSSGLTFHCVFKEKPSSSGQPDGTLSSSPHSHAQSTVEHSLRDVKHHRVQDLQFSTEFKCSDFEEEYRPLPSPTRSSLRSPGKSPCRPKEGMRVTFADSHIEKEVASSRCSPQINRRTAGLRSPTANGQETTGAEGTQTGRAAPAGRGSRASDSCAVPHSACSSLTHHTITVVEPGASGVNKPLSDLYGSMHLEDAASSRCFSEGLSPRRGSSVDRLNESSPLRPLGAPQCSSRLGTLHGRSALYTRMPCSVTLPAEIRRTNSLSSRQSELKNKEDSVVAGCNSLALQSPQTDPDRSSILWRLLDLVDRHWNGTRSLHLNHCFLASAHDLLRSLSSPLCAECQRGRSRDEPDQECCAGRGAGQNSWTSGLDHTELQQLRHKLTITQQQLELLKKRLSSVLKENNSLRTQISSTQVSALSATGENKLQEAYRGLRERVGTVSEKITQSHKLEEALCLLRDSHRSLVSTNDYLLKQLERGSSGQDLDHVQSCLTSDLSRASNGLQSSSSQHTLPSPSQ
ncbi:leucine-rich repeat-containing protein 36-like [Lepisosteus oculatus]|uniref:leucine-rich repeat-containing protein 36-like n=1 Tax=Lepisosteus oculatus TaxID=7918 RepID=UPI0035F50310